MASEDERRAMLRAIELSERGLGFASPNPVVGCVVLDAGGDIAGEGWHRGVGEAHAETVALDAAGASARDGTAVVTLEPCNHTGRTGPCSQALLAAGIRRVVYAVPEANPGAAGGAAALDAAGVEVEAGLLRNEAEAVNVAWLHGFRAGRPYVTWKFAATLDGRSAAADGTSRWITSPEAREDVHLLRSRSDAVVVGSGTVLADDPSLTARLSGGPAPHQPLRVVLDSNGSTPVTARVRNDDAETLVLTASDVGRAASGRGVDLHRSLDVLFQRGVRSVLLEGGPTLAGAFVDAGLVDRVIAYVAPAFLGQGRPSLSTEQLGSTVAAIRRLDLLAVDRVGPDLKVTAVPAGTSD